MTSIYFDNQFYQRGQTWRECLEAWEPEREDFLRRVQRRPVLQSAVTRLSEFPRGARLAVYYSQRTLDSRLALPAIGATLQQATHVETRYFCDAFFFPALYESLGRKAPQILVRSESGMFHPSWGPRPEALTHELARFQDQQPGADPDAWLLGFDPARLHALLDESLAQLPIGH